MTLFERHRRTSVTALLILGCCAGLALVEFSLRMFFGLGHPLLYRSSPLFGYRLQPHQLVHRRGAEIRVNNIGLRGAGEWDRDIEHKIVFLGNSVTFGGTSLSDSVLFSARALEGLPGFEGGNAGVNGWGVENIHALLIGGKFLPARTYVTVLQEMDFYRGLSKLAGKPFWTSPPTFAFEELLGAFWVNRLDGMYVDHDRFVSAAENAAAVERACIRLKELDDFLRSHGYRHFLYMSTNIPQLCDGVASDTLVEHTLARLNIHPIHLKDRPEVQALSMEERRRLFYDWNHLDVPGHALWGKMIGDDLRRALLRDPL